MKECVEQESAICVTRTICACINAQMAGETGGESGGSTNSGVESGTGAGEVAGTSGPRECEPPLLGDLVINEVMIDAEGDENVNEFVEIVNLAERPIDLTGLQITYNGAEKVTFVSGCMDSRSIGALFASEEGWTWSSPPGGVAAVKKSFRFSNSGDFNFVLLDAQGQELSALAGGNDLVSEGVSINRNPDFEGADASPHREISPLASSPGLCVGGGRLEDGCPMVTPGGSEGGAMAGEGAGMSGGGVAGELGGMTPPPECEPPALGELVINEAMIDAEGDENTFEFVELVNLAERPVNLTGLKVTYNGTDKVTFTSGCMAARSIGALFAAEEAWTWSSPPEGVSAEKRSFRFSNSGDFNFVLLDAEGQELSVLVGSNDLVSEGVSVNRSPDFEGAEVATHLTISSLNASPGRCAEGGRLEEGCPTMTPAGSEAGSEAGMESGMEAGMEAGELIAGETAGMTPMPMCSPAMVGDLIINEVMINPVGDESTEEFVELINLSDEARSLAGITLSYNGAEKVIFSAGCMAPLSVATLYGDEDRWLWSVPTEGLSYEKRAYRFSNSADFNFSLALNGQEVAALNGTVDQIEEGVSLNRDPDLDPMSRVAQPHRSLNPDLDESPGRCANGGEVSERCLLPEVDMGVADLGVDDMGMGDMSMGDMGMDDMGMGDMNMGDMNIGDMGMGDMGIGDMGMGDMGIGDMGMGDMGIGDMGIGDMNMGDMNMGDMNMGDMNIGDMGGAETCATPEVGQLIINEVLANPEGNEAVDDSEWIEIVNLTDTAISLEGIALWSEGEAKVNFVALCLPSRSALTLYNLRAPSEWEWSTPQIGEIAAQPTQTFTLTNSRPINLALKRDALELNRFEAGTALIESGVSVNRNPDADPAGAMSLHSGVPGALGAAQSPGRCANGAFFESQCQAQ